MHSSHPLHGLCLWFSSFFPKPVAVTLLESCQSECLGQGRKIFPCLTLRRRQNKDHVLTCTAMGMMERWQGASAGGCSACPRSGGTLVPEDSPPALTPAVSSHCVSNAAGSELLFFPPISRLFNAQLPEPSVHVVFEALSVQGKICLSCLAFVCCAVGLVSGKVCSRGRS